MIFLRNALLCAILLASSAFSDAACPPCPATGLVANFCNLGVSGNLCVGSGANIAGNLVVCGLGTFGGGRGFDMGLRSVPGCSGLTGINCTGPSIELEVLGDAGISGDLFVCGNETVTNLNVCNTTTMENLIVLGTGIINNIVITGTSTNIK